jgi:hypothetical protein
LPRACGSSACACSNPDTEPGAECSEHLAPIGGAVVEVQAFGDPAPQDGLLEDGQERRGVFRKGEGRVGYDARRVVDQRDQISLLLSLVTDGHARTMHHVAHPQFARLLVGEVAPIFARGFAGCALVEPVLREQPMYGGRRESQRGLGKSASKPPPR